MNVNKELMDKLGAYPVNADILLSYNNDTMLFIEEVVYDPVNNIVKVKIRDTPMPR